MHRRIHRALLPVAAALLTTLTVLGPVGGWPAAAKTDPGAITLKRAELIAKTLTYIPLGFEITSTNYNTAQSGQPASYNLNYSLTTAPGQVQANSAYLNVTVDATTGMILNYNRQPQAGIFHDPAAVSPAQAKVIAAAWVKRLYGQYASQVSEVPEQPMSTTLTQPIAYTYTFERVVHGIPAPFDGFSLTLSANGHLTQANANWTSLAFPASQAQVSKAMAHTIYRKSLHFYLVYGQNYANEAAPTTTLSYTQPSAPYPANWSTPFAGALSITTPVIDAQNGQVINSDGVAQPLPVQAQPHMLVAGGPTTFPGLHRVLWTQSESLAYATRILHITAADHFTGASYSVQSPLPDTMWTFSWNGPNGMQISATVDATRGVLTSYNAFTNGAPVNLKTPTKTTAAKAQAAADSFVRRILSQDTGAVAVTLAPFQKFPNGLRHFFDLSFFYHGVDVQAASGMVDVDGETGQVAAFNWQPVTDLQALPSPSKAVSVGQVQTNWMQAEPLTLQYLLTSPQNDFSAQQSQSKLPPARIVLAYAPMGYYGNGMSVDALTGALQNPSQSPVPYTGPIRDVSGASNAADLVLLANDELLPVSPQGDMYPHRVMTQGAFVSLIVGSLGLDNPVMLPDNAMPGMNKALAAIPSTSPYYAAVTAAYTRAWLPLGQVFAPNAPITRGYAAQVLAKALGFAPVLSDPQFFHLAATDALAIPSSQYAGDALAVALGLLSLQNGQFNASAGLTVNQAAQAAIQMANAFATGAQTDQLPQGGMMG